MDSRTEQTGIDVSLSALPHLRAEFSVDPVDLRNAQAFTYQHCGVDNQNIDTIQATERIGSQYQGVVVPV